MLGVMITVRLSIQERKYTKNIKWFEPMKWMNVSISDPKSGSAKMPSSREVS